MGSILVTASRLREGATQLKMMNGKWMKEAENLNTTEASLKSMWEGEANEAFHAAFMRDYGQFQALYSVVEQYASALNLIAERYEQAEAANMQIASARNY